MPTIGPISLAVAADDGEIWSDFFWTDGEDNNGVGKMYFAGENRVWCFYRFVLPSAIPSGATIDSATLELWGEGTAGGWSQGSDDLIVYASDSASASAPTAGSQRPSPDGGSQAVTVSVAWNNITWSTDAYNSSPSLATIIQDLVTDNGGLASGAGIVLWVGGTSAAQAHAQLHDFAGEANVALLTITYTGGGGGGGIVRQMMAHHGG